MLILVNNFFANEHESIAKMSRKANHMEKFQLIVSLTISLTASCAAFVIDRVTGIYAKK